MSLQAYELASADPWSILLVPVDSR